MIEFEPKDPDFARRARESFERQGAMATLGIEIVTVAPGRVTLGMDYSEKLTQQHGFLHAGVVTTALDTASGYAAFTLMEPDAGVLTVEFKTNLLAPAAGAHFVFEAEVLKPGRTITVTEAKAFALREDAPRKLIASMTATMMTIRDRPDVQG